jgi:hypothetical protein
MEAAAIAAIVMLTGLGVFQLSLAAGAPLGRLAWGGKHRTLPTGLRIASAASIALYAGFGAVIADAAGVVDVFGGTWPRTAVAVLTGYFALGVVVNAISRSRPERIVMTPVAAALALLFFTVAFRA